MSARTVVRAFAVVAVATGGLAALKSLRLIDDVARFVALETPAYATAPSQNTDGADDHAPAADDAAQAPGHDGEEAPMGRVRNASCPPPTIADRAGLSHAEIRVLQSLSARRREIDAREAELETRLNLMDAAEERLTARVEELRGLRDEIQTMVAAVSEADAEQNRRLVALYERMEPRAAAPIMENLGDDILISVAMNMREQNLAAVLAAMRPETAVRVTTLIAQSRETVEDIEARVAASRAAGAAGEE